MKKRIILRADDLGYSEAVNYGLAKGCDSGLPLSIGMMMNMDAVQHGYSLIKDCNYCLGIHVNISAGRPLCAADEVVSLIEKDGCFHSSKLYRGAEKDPVSIADAEKETEAQYRAFVKLTGKEPDYFDIHAVNSPAFIQGVRNTAEKHHIPYSLLPDGSETMEVGNTYVCLAVHGSDERSAGQIINDFVQSPHETMILVFHPGYVDQAVMETSSVNLQRIYDTEVLRSEELKKIIKENNIELITYRDLKG